MDSFTDVHCHMLPRADDGAANINEALDMIKIAYEEGIRRIIVTPHYRKGIGKRDIGLYTQQFKHLQNKVRRKFPEITVFPGCEIFYEHDIEEKLRKGEIWTMADSSYVLLEFSEEVPFSYIRGAVQSLRLGGYLPVIAHVERYVALSKIPNVQELVHMGAYIQANAGSVTGRYGWHTKRYLKKLLTEELVHMIGTDAHNTKTRPPKMRECAVYLEKKYGYEYAKRLCDENAKKMIAGKMI